jgi:tRNA (guanine37-N1)-methyltransferase
MFKADIFTLYPALFPGPLGHSLSGDALARGLWALDVHDIRAFGLGRHRAVDDRPAGGGAGMVLRADVVAASLDAHIDDRDQRPRLLMSPRGQPLSQEMVRSYAGGEGVIVVCGRFEGVDERVIAARGLIEVSVGDYILSGGEMAALIVLDACVRLLPGVMGKQASGVEESFENGLLEYPHYTRPREFEGEAIPEVLLSGDHARIAHWRQEQAELLTRHRRPDLWQKRDNKPPSSKS